MKCIVSKYYLGTGHSLWPLGWGSCSKVSRQGGGIDNNLDADMMVICQGYSNILLFSLVSSHVTCSMHYF